MPVDIAVDQRKCLEFDADQRIEQSEGERLRCMWAATPLRPGSFRAVQRWVVGAVVGSFFFGQVLTQDLQCPLKDQE